MSQTDSAALTHGRHCSCSACAREDWTKIVAPCGMHGPSCPSVYAPVAASGLHRVADEAVECAYPGCSNRLRRSDFNEPQFCSKEHRDAAAAPLAARGRVFARTYGDRGGSDDHAASVAELHWPDGRSVQISGATEDDETRGGHVLIRVWPENGTHEYGGSNLTDFSVVLRFDGKGWKITSLDARSPSDA